MRLIAPANTLGRDIQLAAVAFVAGLVVLALGGYLLIPTSGADLPRRGLLGPLVVLCVALALRRIAPLTALGLGVLGLLADVSLGGSHRQRPDLHPGAVRGLRARAGMALAVGPAVSRWC